MKKIWRTGLQVFAYVSIIFMIGFSIWTYSAVGNEMGVLLTPTTFSSLVEKVNPAVVTILIKSDQPNEELKNDPTKQREMVGSGFIVSPDGYIVTNNHVVEGAKDIKVLIDPKIRIDAKVIGADVRSDVALLKIDKPTPNYVKFAPTLPKVGDWVVAIGSPFGLYDTVTMGIVSAQKRFLADDPYDYLQIDASVNHGNSGGPAFNLNGDVVGMNSAIFSPTEGSIGIAFAIPGPVVNKVVGELRTKGYVDRAWLGLVFESVNEATAKQMRVAENGAIIAEVDPMGPAGRSGLLAKDIVVKVGDQDIPDGRVFGRLVTDSPSGVVLKFTVLRDGKETVVPVKTGKFTPELLKKMEPQSKEEKENEDKPHG